VIEDRSRDPLRPDLVEMCWRVASRQHPVRILECGIYPSGAAYEVRVSYVNSDLLYAKAVTDVFAGRQLAEDLKRTGIEDGAFTELRS
jgi:hypothetical protein